MTNPLAMFQTCLKTTEAGVIGVNGHTAPQRVVVEVKLDLENARDLTMHMEYTRDAVVQLVRVGSVTPTVVQVCEISSISTSSA